MTLGLAVHVHEEGENGTIDPGICQLRRRCIAHNRKRDCVRHQLGEQSCLKWEREFLEQTIYETSHLSLNVDVVRLCEVNFRQTHGNRHISLNNREIRQSA